MIEMNTYEKGSLAGFFYGNLVRYRAIPALYILANRGFKQSKLSDKALEGLKSVLRILEFRCLSDADVLEMIDAHKNWICYTFHDMYYYFQFIHDDISAKERDIFEQERMKYYLPAMAEIVHSPFIEWRHGTFDTGIEHPTVLDIGSGNFPFMKLFRRDNHGNIWYIGVDKRGMQDTKYKLEDRVIPHQYIMEADAFLTSKADHLEHWKEQIDVVFFGNSLHCMQEPFKLLEKVAKLPKVSKIMVLEFAPKSALNFMFDFHMYMHAGTGEVKYMPLSIEWKHEISYPTTQHVMYTYTKVK